MQHICVAHILLLTCITLGAIPADIGKMDSLAYLDLKDNKLAGRYTPYLLLITLTTICTALHLIPTILFAYV